MEQKTLKYLRVLIPGLLILIGLLPIKSQIIILGISFNGLDYNYIILLAITIGAIYYQLNIQRIITRPSHYLITKNIYDSLLKIYSQNIDPIEKKNIWKNKIYMDVFYHIIDNDESLKRRSNLVYFNGIFWTSSADIFLISLIYWILYKFNFITSPNYGELTKALVIISFLSLFLHVISVVKHIKLSNNQLKYIERYRKSEVDKKFNELLQRTS
jgi:hypothetical protein